MTHQTAASLVVFECKQHKDNHCQYTAEAVHHRRAICKLHKVEMRDAVRGEHSKDMWVRCRTSQVHGLCVSEDGTQRASLGGGVLRQVLKMQLPLEDWPSTTDAAL